MYWNDNYYHLKGYFGLVALPVPQKRNRDIKNMKKQVFPIEIP